jgi:hypothetical protein
VAFASGNPRLQLLGSGGFSPHFPNIPPALIRTAFIYCLAKTPAFGLKNLVAASSVKYSEDTNASKEVPARATKISLTDYS